MVTEEESWAAFAAVREGLGATEKRLEGQPALTELLGALTGAQARETLSSYLTQQARRDKNARALLVALGLLDKHPGTLSARRKTLKTAVSTLKDRERRAAAALYAHFTEQPEEVIFRATRTGPGVTAELGMSALGAKLTCLPADTTELEVSRGHVTAVLLTTDHDAPHDALQVTYMQARDDQTVPALVVTFHVSSLPSHQLQVTSDALNGLFIVRTWADGRTPVSAAAIRSEGDWSSTLDLGPDAFTQGETFGIDAPPPGQTLVITWAY